MKVRGLTSVRALLTTSEKTSSRWAWLARGQRHRVDVEGERGHAPRPASCTGTRSRSGLTPTARSATISLSLAMRPKASSTPSRKAIGIVTARMRGQQVQEDAEDGGEVGAAGHQHGQQPRDLVDQEDEGEDQEPDRARGQHLADDVAVEQARPREAAAREKGHRGDRSTRPRSARSAASRFRDGPPVAVSCAVRHGPRDRLRAGLHLERGAGLRLPRHRGDRARRPGDGGAGRRRAGVRVLSVSDPRIPCDAARNTAALAALRGPAAGRGERARPRARVEKGLPLSGGLGGSAASAVAGAVAANALLRRPLGRGAAPARARSRPRRWWPGATPTTSPRRSSAAPSLVLGARAPALRAPHRPPVAAPRLRDAGLRRRRPRRPAPSCPRASPRADAVAQAAALAGLVLGLERGDGALLARGDGRPHRRAAPHPALPGLRRARARPRSAPGAFGRGGERGRADAPRDRARGRRGRGRPGGGRGLRARRASAARAPRGGRRRPRGEARVSAPYLRCAACGEILPAAQPPRRAAPAAACSTRQQCPREPGRGPAGALRPAPPRRRPRGRRAAASGASASCSCPAGGRSSPTPRATRRSTAATRSRAASASPTSPSSTRARTRPAPSRTAA